MRSSWHGGCARGSMTVKRVPRALAVDEARGRGALRWRGARRRDRAAAVRLGGEERIEHPVADLRRECPGPCRSRGSTTASPSKRDRRRQRSKLPRADLDAHFAVGGDACTALSARLNTARCSRSSSPSMLTRSPSRDDARRRARRRRDRGARRRDSPRRARSSPRSTGSRRARRARARSRETRRAAATADRDSRITSALSVRWSSETAACGEICSTALRIDASGFLISCASDALSSAIPSRRSARRRSDVHALLIGDVLEDRRRRATGRRLVMLGVGRRDADRKLVDRSTRCLRRASCEPIRGDRSSASASSGAPRQMLIEHVAVDLRRQRQVRAAARPSGWRRAGGRRRSTVIDAAADVAQNVFGPKPGLLEVRGEQRGAFRCPSAAAR